MDIQITRIIILILTNLAIYWKTIKYGIICDDIPVFNQEVVIPRGWWMYFWYHLHGRKYKNIKLAHIITLCLHILNVLLVYIAFGHNLVSFIAALILAVNPVNNQCSIWLSGKGYSLNLTCALLMWMFPVYSIIPYLLGTYFCGPSLILFPLIFLFTKHWWLAGLVIIGLYREKQRVFDNDPKSKFKTESNPELLTIKPRKFIVAFKTYAYYFVNCLSARKLGFYHNYLFLHGVNASENKKSYAIDKYFFLGILLALVTIITRDIGLIWFTVGIMMWCNFISFNQTIANRYLYLPSVGLFITLAALLIKYPILISILLTYYITKLVFFMVFYKNEYWSIEYSCFENPKFFYVWQNRAAHCFQNQNYHGALGNMLKAQSLCPDDWKITYNLCQISIILGNMSAAKHYYEEAKKLSIDGREEPINKLMTRLGKWIDTIETEAKENKNQVNIDLGKFDIQR